MVRKWLSCLGVLGVVAAVGWGSLWGCAERRFGENQGSDVATIARSSTPDLGPLGYRDGVWLTFVGSDVFQSRQSLGQALQQIRDAGFNTVYPVVWNKGCTTFPSETMGRLTGQPICPAFAGRDPLKEILEENERLGLRLAVIPWFEYGLKVVFGRALDPKAPNPNQLADRYELGFKAREQGMLLKRKDGSDAFYDPVSKHYFGFLNPDHPGVAEMLMGIVEEVTSERYAVDGFQIDDHFSVHHEFGCNPEVIENFHSFLDSKNHSKLRFDARGLSQTDLVLQHGLWNDFRGRRVIDLAKGFAPRLPKRPGFVYQISPAGDIGWSMNEWLQNWRALVHDKVVQEFVFQAYRPNYPDFVKLIDSGSIGVSKGRAVAQVGIFAGYKGQTPRSTELLVSQIQAVRKRKMGVSVFFYDTLFTGDSSRVTAIRNALLNPPPEKIVPPPPPSPPPSNEKATKDQSKASPSVTNSQLVPACN
jgi:uncharacterized lipoprotein YddW (UPF0748 family)